MKDYNKKTDRKVGLYSTKGEGKPGTESRKIKHILEIIMTERMAWKGRIEGFRRSKNKETKREIERVREMLGQDRSGMKKGRWVLVSLQFKISSGEKWHEGEWETGREANAKSQGRVWERERAGRVTGEDATDRRSTVEAGRRLQVWTLAEKRKEICGEGKGE